MTQPPIEQLIGQDLAHLGWRLATAESLTGGLISQRITSLAGSSAYFLGGVTAYSSEAKQNLLGVLSTTLQTEGAVSRQTALEMASGARRVFQAQVSVSTTGIAGPGGAEPGKPVGTVWIGASAGDLSQAWLHHFEGDRGSVRSQTAETALGLLHLVLQACAMPRLEVTARRDRQGRLSPLEFTWQDRLEQVESLGRRHTDALGEHILCRTPAGAVFNLYHLSEGGWRLEKAHPGRSAA